MDKSPRPRQVVLGGAMAAVTSGMLVLTSFDTRVRVRGTEMRRDVEEALSTPPGDGLGWSTAAVLDGLEVLVYVSAVLAAIALIFAIFSLRKDKAARIGLAVTSALLVLTSPVAGFLAILVAVATTLLWSGPARDWYAGRPIRDTPSANTLRKPSLRTPTPQQDPQMSTDHSAMPPEHPHTPGGQTPSGEQSAEQPPAWPTPYGQPAQNPAHDQPHQEQYPAAAQYPPNQHFEQTYGAAPQQGYNPWEAPGVAGSAARRPRTVFFAVLLTWFGSLMVAGFSVLAGVGVSVQSGEVADQFNREYPELSLSAAELATAVWIVATIFVFWCLAASVIAALVLRRKNWARVLLTISAVMTVLISLIGILAIVPIVTLLMGIATIVLLYTGGANEWFRGDDSRTQPPSGFHRPYPQQGNPPGAHPDQAHQPNQPAEPKKPAGPW